MDMAPDGDGACYPGHCIDCSRPGDLDCWFRFRSDDIDDGTTELVEIIHQNGCYGGSFQDEAISFQGADDSLGRH